MTAAKTRPRWWLAIVGTAVAVSAVLLAACFPSVKAAWMGAYDPDPNALRANFFSEPASPQVHRVADQIVGSADHRQQPFVLVDKVNARVYVFAGDGGLRASSPALIGSAVGDDSVPGIGLRPIADILPAERTTPAGKFLSEAGHNAKGEDIVWVDYDAAISMHRVRATNPAEQRLERLATPMAADNRISYGCINVPAAFFDEHVSPVFRAGKSFVYVLPEVKPDALAFGWSLDPGTPIAAK